MADKVVRKFGAVCEGGRGWTLGYEIIRTCSCDY